MHEEQRQHKRFHRERVAPLKLNESWAGRRLVEALSHLPPQSLSSSLDMRFQQKQLQEREQKKLALTTAAVANNHSPASARNAIGNGKVREMFDRRRGAGIDRSHPLKPISSTATVTLANSKSIINQQQGATMRRAAGGANPIASARRSVITNKQAASNTSMHNSHSHPDDFPSNGNLFGGDLDQMDNLESETFPKEFSSLSLDNTRIMGAPIHDGNNNLNKSSNGIGRRDIMDTTTTLNNRRSNTSHIKLNPVVMKKSPNALSGSKTARSGPVKQRPTSGSVTSRTPATARLSMSTNGLATTSSTSSTAAATTKSPPLKKPSVSTTGVVPKGSRTTTRGSSNSKPKPTTFVMAVKPPPRVVTPPPGMATCQYCHRNFNEDRLDKHQEVCRKMTETKRKVFDASKHRVQGTEAEKYVRKVGGRSSTSTVAGAHRSVNANNSSGNTTAAVGKKPNWRKKHEDFINAIREAKKVQAFLAKGGKLSDLPPPTPSENPDYIQCPHCGRRFNETAAERHIPKCADMKHNKPKPPVQKKRY